MKNRRLLLHVEELERRVVPSLVYSNNWSGYAAMTNLSSPQAQAVDAVSGSWIVPSVTGSSTTYSSAWVGIDGYSSSTVEQIGTEQDWINGSGAFYRAWYEMYPAAPVTVPVTISPGDQISASVTYNGTSFVLSIMDTTTGNSFTTTQTLAGAQRSSAEWIVEAPSGSFGHVLPLANFGQVTFSGASATINGTTGPIDDAAWQNTAIDMVSKNKIIASTSALSDTGGTSSFTVTFTGSSGGGGTGGHHHGPDQAIAGLPAASPLSTMAAMIVVSVPSTPASPPVPLFTVPAPAAILSSALSSVPSAVASDAGFAGGDDGMATPGDDDVDTPAQTPAMDGAPQAPPANPDSNTAPDATFDDVDIQTVADYFAGPYLAEIEANRLAPIAEPSFDVASSTGLALLVLALNFPCSPEEPRRGPRREKLTIR
jgi:hypothetical protein